MRYDLIFTSVGNLKTLRTIQSSVSLAGVKVTLQLEACSPCEDGEGISSSTLKEMTKLSMMLARELDSYLAKIRTYEKETNQTVYGTVLSSMKIGQKLGSKLRLLLPTSTEKETGQSTLMKLAT